MTGSGPSDFAAREARLLAELAAKDALLREQAAALAHSRKIFARASEAARIGVWECSLPDEALQWSDVTYDIFDLPRGAPLVRAELVKRFTGESAAELRRLRDRAISERSGFVMEAEIVTFRDRRRWLRVTATVELENNAPVRIFGMKQDITEQKILLDRTRYLAEFDQMTGLANRTQFQARFNALTQAGEGALLLVDLDGFKAVNDTRGHAVGDECLKEAARRLQAACAGADLVARLGGDEFAVLAGPRLGRTATADCARAIVEALARPVMYEGAALRLGASVGVAFVGGHAAEAVFKMADAALYAAKAAGRNGFRVHGH